MAHFFNRRSVVNPIDGSVIMINVCTNLSNSAAETFFCKNGWGIFVFPKNYILLVISLPSLTILYTCWLRLSLGTTADDTHVYIVF